MSCNYKTSTTIYFKRHQKLNHEPGSDISKIITCTECEYQTLDPILVIKHNRAKHFGEIRYYCDICEYKSFYRHYVSLHIISRHKDTNARTKTVNCTKCQINVDHGKCCIKQQIKSEENEGKN